ncbi:DMT family transporter [Goodfellowiella coeruleoviolacea]|uniref:Small multidrug resistance pump n=1 Tax=Goodfellowiella coeruleoviolacea TaxID=334858 RepID=A0AAE3GLN5_9PSEU|nr:multidrug efflux SMR transporter [Goodfellowiella coeruleoviolacea]MCP2169694.1 small multidrug resistance pump [Goodfellowiella coeruleoviolacea]
MAYLFLLGAIVFEVAGTTLLKSTEGFTRLWPTLACLFSYAVAFLTLALAIQRGLQIGVAYAVWSALGTTLIVAIGALFLHEPITLAKIIGVVLVVAGVVVLNLSGAH